MRGASSRTIFARTASTCSPVNTGRPVRHSNSTQPTANTSQRGPTSRYESWVSPIGPVGQPIALAMITRDVSEEWELYEALRCRLAAHHPRLADAKPVHGPFRTGDVLQSLADIGKAQRLLGYKPTHTLEQGLDEAREWYERNVK